MTELDRRPRAAAAVARRRLGRVARGAPALPRVARALGAACPSRAAPIPRSTARRSAPGAARGTASATSTPRTASGCSSLDGRFAGEVSLGSVQRGPFQMGYIGYWIDEALAGHGYVPEGVVLMMRYAFEALQPAPPRGRDRAAQRARAGASPRSSGYATRAPRVRFLQIQGVYEDHIRYAITAEEWHERGHELVGAASVDRDASTVGASAGRRAGGRRRRRLARRSVGRARHVARRSQTSSTLGRARRRSDARRSSSARPCGTVVERARARSGVELATGFESRRVVDAPAVGCRDSSTPAVAAQPASATRLGSGVGAARVRRVESVERTDRGSASGRLADGGVAGVDRRLVLERRLDLRRGRPRSRAPRARRRGEPAVPRPARASATRVRRRAAGRASSGRSAAGRALIAVLVTEHHGACAGAGSGRTPRSAARGGRSRTPRQVGQRNVSTVRAPRP